MATGVATYPLAAMPSVAISGARGHVGGQDVGGILAAVLLTPAVLGELGLTLWLLIKGVAARHRTAEPN